MSCTIVTLDGITLFSVLSYTFLGVSIKGNCLLPAFYGILLLLSIFLTFHFFAICHSYIYQILLRTFFWYYDIWHCWLAIDIFVPLNSIWLELNVCHHNLSHFFWHLWVSALNQNLKQSFARKNEHQRGKSLPRKDKNGLECRILNRYIQLIILNRFGLILSNGQSAHDLHVCLAEAWQLSRLSLSSLRNHACYMIKHT